MPGAKAFGVHNAALARDAGSRRKRRLVPEGGLDGQGGVEVCQEGATVREFLGPEPEMGGVQTGVAPAALPEQSPGGGGDTLVEEADVGEGIGK